MIFQVMLKSLEKLTAKPGSQIESRLLGSLFAEQVFFLHAMFSQTSKMLNW
jgi:hypothetical protein